MTPRRFTHQYIVTQVLEKISLCEARVFDSVFLRVLRGISFAIFAVEAFSADLNTNSKGLISPRFPQTPRSRVYFPAISMLRNYKRMTDLGIISLRN
jgi:hypothetical protein